MVGWLDGRLGDRASDWTAASHGELRMELLKVLRDNPGVSMVYAGFDRELPGQSDEQGGGGGILLAGRRASETGDEEEVEFIDQTAGVDGSGWSAGQYYQYRASALDSGTDSGNSSFGLPVTADAFLVTVEAGSARFPDWPAGWRGEVVQGVTKFTIGVSPPAVLDETLASVGNHYDRHAGGGLAVAYDATRRPWFQSVGPDRPQSWSLPFRYFNGCGSGLCVRRRFGHGVVAMDFGMERLRRRAIEKMRAAAASHGWHCWLIDTQTTSGREPLVLASTVDETDPAEGTKLTALARGDAITTALTGGQSAVSGSAGVFPEKDCPWRVAVIRAAPLLSPRAALWWPAAAALGAGTCLGLLAWSGQAFIRRGRKEGDALRREINELKGDVKAARHAQTAAETREKAAQTQACDAAEALHTADVRAQHQARALIRESVHDLRNIVYPVQLGMDSLARACAGGHPPVETPERLGEMAQSLYELVEHMQSEIIAESAGAPHRLRKFDIGELVSRVVGRQQAHAASRGLTITANTPVDGERILTSNPWELTRIAENLITNAIRYSSSTAARVVCEVSAIGQSEALEGRWWRLSVINISDAGERDLERMRERAKSPGESVRHRRNDMAIIGLSNVKALIAALGGHPLEFELNENRLKVSFRVPDLSDRAPEAPAWSPPEASRKLRCFTKKGNTWRPSVLFADDYDMVRREFELWARDFARVTLARSGDEAEHLTLQQNFDLIIIDHSMPVRTGAETLRRIRRRWPDQRAIICTGTDPGHLTGPESNRDGIPVVLKDGPESLQGAIVQEFTAMGAKPVYWATLETTLEIPAGIGQSARGMQGLIKRGRYKEVERWAREQSVQCPASDRKFYETVAANILDNTEVAERLLQRARGPETDIY